MSGTSPSIRAGRPELVRTTVGTVAVFTLTDDRSRNALGAEMRQALSQALDDAAADPGIRAVVLTGANGCFSSGGDLSAMPPADRGTGAARMAEVTALLTRLATFEKPVVAAVSGPAAGVAVGLVCCCDLVIAGQDARFLFPFTRLGLVPDGGLLHSLTQRLGVGRARSVLLQADPVDAGQAMDWGLVDQVVPAASALDHAVAQAQELAGRAPLAVAATKRGLLQASASLHESLAFERQHQPDLFETADFKEGKAAFQERRIPSFIAQ